MVLDRTRCGNWSFSRKYLFMLKRKFFKVTISIAIAFVFLSCSKNSDLKSINQPPIAYAGKDTIIVLPLNTVVLDGSGSNDPDGAITGHLWSEISGPLSFNI